MQAKCLGQFNVDEVQTAAERRRGALRGAFQQRAWRENLQRVLLQDGHTNCRVLPTVYFYDEDAECARIYVQNLSAAAARTLRAQLPADVQVGLANSVRDFERSSHEFLRMTETPSALQSQFLLVPLHRSNYWAEQRRAYVRQMQRCTATDCCLVTISAAVGVFSVAWAYSLLADA
jgi:hypothetical protein